MSTRFIMAHDACLAADTSLVVKARGVIVTLPSDAKAGLTSILFFAEEPFYLQNPEHPSSENLFSVKEGQSFSVTYTSDGWKFADLWGIPTHKVAGHYSPEARSAALVAQRRERRAAVTVVERPAAAPAPEAKIFASRHLVAAPPPAPMAVKFHHPIFAFNPPVVTQDTRQVVSQVNRQPQAVIATAAYACDVNDTSVTVLTVGVTVTLPQNPVSGVTAINFLAVQSFNLTAGALAPGLQPADPLTLPAGENITACYSGPTRGWLLTGASSGVGTVTSVGGGNGIKITGVPTVNPGVELDPTGAAQSDVYVWDSGPAQFDLRQLTQDDILPGFAISSFTGGSTVEVGATVTNPAFNATYTSTPTTSAAITNTDAIDSPLALVNPYVTGTVVGAFTHAAQATVTFTLTAVSVTTKTATQAINFFPRSFGGVGRRGCRERDGRGQHRGPERGPRDARERGDRLHGRGGELRAVLAGGAEDLLLVPAHGKPTRFSRSKRIRLLYAGADHFCIYQSKRCCHFLRPVRIHQRPQQLVHTDRDLMKTCRMCNKPLPLTDFHPNRNAKDKLQYSCKRCMKQYANTRRRVLMADPATAEARRAKERGWSDNRRATSPDRYKAITTNSLLQKAYGISLQEFNRLSTLQGEVCAICRSKCSNYSRLSVDHDHNTGAIRGLLCNTCNRGVGLLKDDPAILRTAAAYLERASVGMSTKTFPSVVT